MANTYNQQFNPAFLSQNQQDLLMAALQTHGSTTSNVDLSSNRNSLDFTGSLDPQMLSNTESNGLYQDFEFDAQFLELLDANGQPLDIDFDQDEGSPEGDVNPSAIESNGADQGEKRKSMADDKQDSENGSKRREGDDKQAKKPGRKPLTSEPTSKRKAQNRAAQRAFRERKEKHLKDLETKVEELEKTSESTTHENGLLRAQIERLQMELHEYRRRLSSQTALGRSPPNSVLNSFSSAGTANAINAFNFEYTRFGSQNGSFESPLLFSGNPIQTSPQSTMLDFNSSNSIASRHTSTDGNSPASNQVNTPATSDATRSQHGSVSQDSPMAGTGSPYANDIFGFGKMRSTSAVRRSSESPGTYNIFTSPTTAEPTSINQSNTDSQNPQSRVFQFNPTSSASPSASSSSHYSGNGTNSSCGTSPEPTVGVNKEPTLDTIDESSKQKEFMEQMGSACGDKNNPKPATVDLTTTSEGTDPLTANSNPFSMPGGDFDVFSASLPDFPETNLAVQSYGSFTGGFFNNAPSIYDMSGPMNWNDLTGSMRTGLTPSTQKPNPFDNAFGNPLPHIKEEEVVPADGELYTCTKIWAEIQQRPDFKDGNLDIDNLCTELRKKAKCSESGVVVDKHDVDAALQRLPQTNSRT